MVDVFGDKQSCLRVNEVSLRLNGGMGKDWDNGELTTLNKNVNDPLVVVYLYISLIC